jgi:hypothetical protein
MYLRWEKKRFFLDMDEIAKKERPSMIEVKEFFERKNSFKLYYL